LPFIVFLDSISNLKNIVDLWEGKMRVCHVNEMRRLDRTAMERFGIKEELLMENAGESSYFAILKEIKDIKKRFAIFCGAGNNGGDGFVVARKLYSNGADVVVFLLGDPEKYRGAAKMNLDIIRKIDIPIKKIESIEDLEKELAYTHIIVDAIFGTGLTRQVEGIYKEVIRVINKSREAGKKVVSIDIPSGVSGDSGQVMGAAVKADMTITFGLPKVGNLLYPGYELCGKLYVTHISFPPELYNDPNILCEINEPLPIPEREKTGHKGSFGDVLFIAGAKSYFGAPYLSAYSFLKAGGGYSRLAAPGSIIPHIASLAPEIVFLPQVETEKGTISLKNKEELLEMSEKVDMVVVGPGISLNEETQRLVVELVESINKPVLIDGDGITAISKNIEVLKRRKEITVLTPHLGEMQRITGISISEINKDKINILQKTCEELKAIVVLKGAHSLIGLPDKRVFINMTGNPGMATAGSGDVLTGTICAMFGLGLSIENAVRMGVLVHGLAGDIAAENKGEDGITAKDILEHLPDAVRLIRRGDISPYCEII